MTDVAGTSPNQPLLEVKDLKVHFETPDGVVKAVDGVSFTIHRGMTLGVVGESGSGKSVTFMTVMGLINRRHAQVSGQVIFEGVDLLRLPLNELRQYRGTGIAMIFQDPTTSLHPLYKVGDQIAEAIRAHGDVDRKTARERAVAMLDRVGIPNPRERARQYPHEFSGGMLQRSMIAMALSSNPKLLIADEPTTALDVTVQAQIVDLIDKLKTEFDTAVALITHDLGLVAEHTDTIQVMYAGRVVESGSRSDIFHGSHHPYTWGLMQSISRLDEEQERLHPIKGSPPSLIFVPKGCAFHPRCPYVMDVCKTEEPPLVEEEFAHSAACHLTIEDKERIFAQQVEVQA
jgi:peptide/nickel transport system ATP-binding protein